MKLKKARDYYPSLHYIIKNKMSSSIEIGLIVLQMPKAMLRTAPDSGINSTISQKDI